MKGQGETITLTQRPCGIPKLFACPFEVDLSALCAANLRWLPGAGGNALQRHEARKQQRDLLCLQVEIPTPVRRRVALQLRELAIDESLTASCL